MQIKVVVTLFFLIITYSSFAGFDTPTCVYTTLPKVHKSPCIAPHCSSKNGNYTQARLGAIRSSSDAEDASGAYYKAVRELNVLLVALLEITGNFDGPLARLTPIQGTYGELLSQIKKLIDEETKHLAGLEMCTTDECDRNTGMSDPEDIEKVRAQKATIIEKLKQTAAAWNSEISRLDSEDINGVPLANSQIDLSAINEEQSKVMEAKRRRRRIRDRVASSVKCTEDDQYICIGDVACTLKGVEYKIKGVYCSSDTEECPSVADECIDRPAQIVRGDGEKPQNGDRIIETNNQKKKEYDGSLATDGGAKKDDHVEAGGGTSTSIGTLQ